MILGKIVGKTTTNTFDFEIKKDVNKYDYVVVWHKRYGYVLAQIVEIVVDEEVAIGKCIVLGYLDNTTEKLNPIKYPLQPNSEVLKPNEEDIRKFLKLNQKGLYVGLLRDSDIKVYLDIDKLITKHLAILAKTGAGKSYTVGVILEELLEHEIPALVIDVHGEYITLTQKNDDSEELEKMPRFGIKPKGYSNLQHYGSSITNAVPLSLKDSFTSKQILKLFPKLNATQKGLLFEAMKGVDEISLKDLVFLLTRLDSNKKWSLIGMIEEYLNSGIFSSHYVSYNELIQSNKISIIDLKGFMPNIQEVIVFKLLSDLFELRKLNKVPPFLLILEEAHNFCPERNFGEKITSEIIRTIASEGRKFGLGLAIVSQRPSRVDKNVLSQCNTQIIMKITNPNDLKAIVQSVEGIYEGADNEIKNLPVGQAMISGILDVPIIVEIRTRRTKHGGKSISFLEDTPSEDSVEKFKEDLEEFRKKEILPIIMPKISENDIKILYNVKKINKILIPVALFTCESNKRKFVLMADLLDGNIVVNCDTFEKKKLPNLEELDVKEINVLEKAYYMQKFTLDEMLSHSHYLDTKDLLKSLVKKGYLIFNGGYFLINKDIILTDLSHFNLDVNPEYTTMSYDKKLEPKIDLDKLKEKLSQFTKVIKIESAFLLKYEWKK